MIMGDIDVPVDGVSLPNKVVAVAVSRDNNSKYAARWAINNLLTHKYNPSLILIHVRKQHPDMDSTDLDEQSHLTDADITQLFKPFRAYCARKEVQAKEIVLDNDDISEALLNYIDDNIITHIVLGASTRSTLQKQWRSHDIPTMINKSAPGFCSVYVITKTEIQSVRPAVVPAAIFSNIPTPNCRTMLSQLLTRNSEPVEDVRENQGSVKSERRHRSRWANLSLDAIDILFRGEKSISSHNPCGVHTDSHENQNFISHVVTAQDEDFTTLQESTEEAHTLPSKNVGAKLRSMKLELKQTIGVYNRACKETLTARKKVKDIQQWKMEATPKFEKSCLLEEPAHTLSTKENAIYKAAIIAAEKAEKLAKMEAERRRLAELNAKRDAEAKERALNHLFYNDVRYRKYTIQEIEAATDHFSDSLKIGEGGYGPVYNGKLDHTKVAIKVLGLGAAQGKKQFQREVEVLSCMRHPNMVLLLGACPHYGCLVYEYMNYGSLEDRLFRKGNTPPISWRIRFKIAADIATGLLFLHNAKPEPLVHRDLKPANILLDSNYTCKIGDVGLSRLLPASVVDNVTRYRMTSAAGTFCYIDPEYQQTGKLVAKSDLYSFGVMLLQILTARPPMGLIRHVERSIADGIFEDLLDPTVPDWPVEEALAFAKIALRCVSIKQKDRPDLSSVVLPELDRLKQFGIDNISDLGSPDSNT